MKVLLLLLFLLGLVLARSPVESPRLSNNDTQVLNPTTEGGSCGGNCPGGHCTSCPCGTKENIQSITEWCGKYSGWRQSSCECIMKHESGGNANAVNQDSGSQDVGLWQVNTQNWASCSGGKPPCDPTTNLGCAQKVFAWGGNTWRLWSTCEVCGVCSSN